MYPWVCGLLIAGLIGLLSACAEPTIEDGYDEYLSRLARVLDQDLPNWQANSTGYLQQRYPGAKGRLWQTTDTRLGVFDFLALDDCNLMNLVSERNSSLGKVMSPTSRYQYEWLILQGVAQCIEQLKEKPEEAELVTTLKEVLETKRKEIGHHYWNATWGSLEFQTFFSLSQPVLDLNEVSGFKPTAVEALETYILALPGQNNTNADLSKGVFEQSSQLEKHLQPLQYHYAGRLLKSLVLADLAISQATQLLQQVLDERPICYNQQPSQKATILNTVLTKYYVLALQPYLSRLEKEANYLWAVMSRHSPKELPFQKAAVITFTDSYFSTTDVDNLLARMRSTTKAHARQWSDLLQQCGIRVGNQG